MNKFIIFVLFFNFPVKSESIEMSAVLEFKTKINYSKIYKFYKNKKKISMDGIKLTPEDYIFSLKEISYIMKSPLQVTTMTNCFAGVYAFARNNKGKVLSEKGCINSKRFEYLLFSFKKIKK